MAIGRSEIINLQTPEIELAFSSEDGGLRALQRRGGPNLVGYGVGRPSIDLRLNEGGWLAERSFVRYLNHHVIHEGNLVQLEIVIGLGPIKAFDRFRIVGSHVTRSLELRNVGEDPVRLRGVRLAIPWVRAGALDACRFEAPGASVRPRVMLSVAAQQRLTVLPRRFFAPGLRDNRAIELAPLFSPGLLAVRNLETDETLLCWCQGGPEPAYGLLEGNDLAVTLAHEVALAGMLLSERSLTMGSQHIVVQRAGWQSMLGEYRRIWASAYTAPEPTLPDWLHDAAIYELHPAQLGGFAGIQAALPDLSALGINTLCLLPIWPSGSGTTRLWESHWQSSGDPYALHEFEALNPALGTVEELAACVSQAHAIGMRVLVDLPLLGCAAESRYLYEHPDWFCRDEQGRLALLNDHHGIIAFDWASSSLRDHVVTQITELARRTGIDGVRAITPRVLRTNWGSDTPGHVSLGQSGHVSMLPILRTALRGLNADSVVIGDLAGPVGGSVQDASIDELIHHMLVHTALSRLLPAELAEWLEDHHASMPHAGIRISFTESHRTPVITPLANGLRGSRISRLLLAGVVLCGCVPSIWAGQERNEAHTITRLLEVRRTHVALRRGTIQYDAIPCNSPQVLTVLRAAESDVMIGLLHVGSHRQNVNISLPVDKLGLTDRSYRIFDLLRDRWWDEQSQQSWQRHELLALSLTLEPFSAYFFELVAVPASSDT